LRSAAPFFLFPASLVQRERVLAVIPARLGSERLPRKPLHVLAGRPLIEWVWRRVSRLSTLDACVVATDSDEIARLCRGFGAVVEMTSAAHASGTERVAEVAERAEYAGYDVVVNVQGDEPFVTEAEIDGAVACVRAGWDIGTIATPVRTLDAWRDPSVVKVVRRGDGSALYFSRSPIPHVRDGEPDVEALGGADFLRHVGVYACRREALRRWVALPEASLERHERLEQLRALAAGLTIGVAVVERAERGVDTAADAERAAALLTN
jgi:3-deoxy-manno-octulosonate cytidylyltransferase (CMP-KDO synthetase)